MGKIEDIVNKKCVFDGCPFDAWYDNLCEYHLLLVDFWFYELGGVKYTPAKLTFTMDGKQCNEPMYPETADQDIATYRDRYQRWAAGLGQEGRDKIVIDGGGKTWDDYIKDREMR